jgi:hypothetical protein
VTSVVLIHGTGVREPAFGALVTRVEENIREVAPTAVTIPCYWGGECGSRLNLGGKSVPSYDTARSLSPMDTEDTKIALWSLLIRDPLYELRMLADRSAGGAQGLGQETVGEVLGILVESLEPQGPLLRLLEEASLVLSFRSARDEVVGSSPYRRLMLLGPAALPECREAVARAIVAQAIGLNEGELLQAEVTPAWTVSGPCRDSLVTLLSESLGGLDRGVGGWVLERMSGLGAWYATGVVRRKRGAITDAAAPATGDILLYQSRGAGIRDFIRHRILASRPPVVVLAHSLGGIAAVDVLVQNPSPNVELLITVGSQASFLYEIGALFSLQCNEPLPVHFPRWVNFYDIRDFLSYLAAPVFGDASLSDIEVDNGESFPRSHSAYWSNPVFWRLMRRELAGVGEQANGN